MFTNIVLGGSSFQIPSTDADKRRRRTFFAEVKENPAYVTYRPTTGSVPPRGVDTSILLKPEEYALLDALHIQGNRIVELSNELPLFFDVLPTCSSDTSMMLKGECDVAYYVLWSVLYKMQLQERDQVAQDLKTKHAVGLTEMAVHSDIVGGLDQLQESPESPMDTMAILRLFTRPAHPSLARLPGKLTTEDVKDMYTLRQPKQV